MRARARAAAAERARPPRGAAPAVRRPAPCSPARSAWRPTGPQPGVIVHTSPFLLIDMAAASDPRRRPAGARRRARARRLRCGSGYPDQRADSEAEVMWSKLVRLNALACTTSAHDKLLGEIRSTPRAARRAGGRDRGGLRRGPGRRRSEIVPPSAPCRSSSGAHATLGSSMQRDIAAGRAPELDAIPGAVLRAAARHGLSLPDDRARWSAMIAAARQGGPAAAAPPERRAVRRGGFGARRRGDRPGAPAWRSPPRPRSSASLSSLSCSPSQSTRKLPGHAAVGVDRDAGKDLLALLEPEPLHVEVRQADAVGGVGRVLAVVGGDRLREALEVLGDLARVRHLLAG